MGTVSTYGTGFAYELRRVREATGMTEATLARALGSGNSTVRAWLAGTRAPNTRHADRIVELASIVDRLALIIHADYIAVWLIKPTPALDDRAPVEAIAAGDYQQVSRLVAAVESPVAA